VGAHMSVSCPIFPLLRAPWNGLRCK
jgi:hypothetical protein